jgi:5S rRNA maturation endonuclease (ribonuclease M5)
MCGLRSPTRRIGPRGGQQNRMRDGVDPAATLEEFLDLWERIRAASAVPGTIVVVEGERDRRAVRRLGLPGTVLALHGGRTLAETAQVLVRRARKVVILTDWDTEGGHLAHRLGEFLTAEPLTLDLDTRRRMARVLRGELVHVEGLYGWARRLAEKAGDNLEERIGPVEAPVGPTG